MSTETFIGGGGGTGPFYIPTYSDDGSANIWPPGGVAPNIGDGVGLWIGGEDEF